MAVTTAAIVGMVATAATTTASFAQAGKQRKLQRQAESEAEKAMEEAKKKLGVNYYEELGINKEVYETEREAQLVAAAQVLEAARESDRGAEATAGRVMLAEQEAQKDISKRMSEEILAIDAAIAGEQSRLRDIGVQLNLEETAGAQLAAAQADEMAGLATQQALQGVVSLGQQAAAAVPLFSKTQSASQFGKLASDAKKVGLTQEAFQKQLASFGATTPTFGQLAGVGTMDPMKFAEFMGTFSPDYLKSLRQSFNPTGIYTKSIPGVEAIGPVE